jgi:hypothetical protein
MCGEHEASAWSMDLFDACDHRIDKAGMVVIQPQLVQRWGIGAHRFARLGEVLAVLATAAVRRERRGSQHERVTHTVVTHLRDRVGQVRLPVSVAEVNRQVDTHRIKLGSQRVDQGVVLIVDR